MPTFCRHNRMVERCPICSKQQKAAPSTRSAPRRPSKPAGPTRAPRKSTSTGMVTRRMQRAPDDGYEHDLVPGLRSSEDARRLAEEVALSAARLRAPAPSLDGGSPDGTVRLAFLAAYLWPLDGVEDPYASARAVADDVALLDSVPLGLRTSHTAGRGAKAVEAFDAWAARGGGPLAALVGDEDWDGARRFDRAFERTAFGGFLRGGRLEFLLLVDRLGLASMDVNTLHLSAATATDPVLLAAKRILGIGDALLLRRRANDLAAGVGVPVAALDLALYNWSVPTAEQRTLAGASVEADETTRDRVAAALGL